VGKTDFFQEDSTPLNLVYSFVELDKLYLKIKYAGLGQKLSGWGAMIGQSTSIREKKSVDQTNIFKVFQLILGRISFSFFKPIS
jgi:hypothetical protein